MYYFQGLFLSLIFLMYLSIRWQCFSHYDHICSRGSSISTPELCSIASCQHIYNTPQQVTNTIVLLYELLRIPSSCSQRSHCSAIILLMHWPGSPDYSYLCSQISAKNIFFQSFGVSVSGQENLGFHSLLNGVGNNTQALELDTSVSGLASKRYYSGSATWLHNGLGRKI